jgi:hypothetical protein
VSLPLEEMVGAAYGRLSVEPVDPRLGERPGIGTQVDGGDPLRGAQPFAE